MRSLTDSMQEYKRQLKRGHIQEAYRGLMGYFRELRSHFARKYPAFSVSSAIYYGYMDMTYFALSPKSLKRRKLKIAIVFVHETFRFEVWLSGSNRDVQARYWDLVRRSDWRKYQLASDPRAVDYVLAHVLIEAPDFADLGAMTDQIAHGTLAFIEEVETFLSGRGYDEQTAG